MVTVGGTAAIEEARAEIRELQRRLSEAEERIKADRTARVGTLAAGMAHEINNPLAYILANVGFVTEELPNIMRSLPGGGVAVLPRVQEIVRALADAREGAERIRQIVYELKAFARAEDDLRLPIDVRAPLEAACHLAEAEAGRRAEFVKRIVAVPLVVASESRLRQMFVYLLMNAVQALDGAKGERREITVKTFLSTLGEVGIEVTDSGAGIPSALLPRVFDPFFSLRPPAASAGFGLATCESIAHAYGGSITVTSELGRGTTFRVLLPAHLGSPLTSLAPLGPVARGRVLVVDDELAVVDSIRRVLGRDHDVTVAVRPIDALDALARGEDFDLILCDVMMPEMGGLELYAKITATRPDIIPRLVFMTGGAFTPKARAFLDSVPNARVSKPFDLAELRAFVAARIPRG